MVVTFIVVIDEIDEAVVMFIVVIDHQAESHNAKHLFNCSCRKLKEQKQKLKDDIR